jgi:hypothetical protein
MAGVQPEADRVPAYALLSYGVASRCPRFRFASDGISAALQQAVTKKIK